MHVALIFIVGDLGSWQLILPSPAGLQLLGRLKVKNLVLKEPTKTRFENTSEVIAMTTESRREGLVYGVLLVLGQADYVER